MFTVVGVDNFHLPQQNRSFDVIYSLADFAESNIAVNYQFNATLIMQRYSITLEYYYADNVFIWLYTLLL